MKGHKKKTFCVLFLFPPFKIDWENSFISHKLCFMDVLSLSNIKGFSSFMIAKNFLVYLSF